MAFYSTLYKFLFLIPLLAILSCKTEVDGPIDPDNLLNNSETYVHFKVNGEEKNYILARAAFDQDATYNLYHFALVGVKDLMSTDTTNTITFIIFDEAPITTDIIYANDCCESGNSIAAQAFRIYYNDENGSSYNSVDKNLSQIDGSLDGGATLTAISETTVKGTFSGTVFNDDKSVSVEITDGEFVAEIL